MVIGFSNGVFNKIQKSSLERLSEKYFNIFKKWNAIEINCVSEVVIDNLFEIKKEDYEKFAFLSFHMPAIKDNEEFLRVMDKIKKLAGIFNIKNILFHADQIEDWYAFNDYKELPISVENMESFNSPGEKDFGKTVDDIESIIKRTGLNLTLDLNHCFTNDKTMKLAEDFQIMFEDKIVEYHISGFKKDFLHYPLFKTKQNIIINSLKFEDVPIIIESEFEKIGEETEEFDYISSHLKFF